jgi:biopolymer transport protein ExbD
MAITMTEPGSAGKRSVDVELNLVPFIDMMSCLVAFLLITAVWTSVAQVRVSPRGRAPDGAEPSTTAVEVAVLVTTSGTLVGATGGAPVLVPPGDPAALVTTLAGLPRGVPLTVAAEDGVHVQAIVSAMDAAMAAGYEAVAYADPGALSVPLRR